MNPDQLAGLLATADDTTRDSLLDEHADLADAALARALKARYLDALDSDPAAVAGAISALTSLATRLDDEETRALAEWTTGLAALQVDGRAERAIELVESAAARFAALAQPYDAAATQVSKVYALALLGRYDEAIACGEQARDVFLAHGDLLTAGKVVQNLGNIYHRRDQYADAERCYRMARDHFVAVGDERLIAYAENGLANVLALQHSFGAAEELYEQALERSIAAGAEMTRAEVECNLGCLALFRGRYDQALTYLERSRRRYESLEMPHQSVLADLELAEAYLELNLFAEAEAIYARAGTILTETGMRAEHARALARRGRAVAALGRVAEATAMLAEARELYTAEGNAVGAALATLAEAQVLLGEGDFAASAAAAAAAAATFAAAGTAGDLLTARWLHAEARRRLGDSAAARDLLSAVLHDAQTRGTPQVERRCQTSLGLIAAADGDSAVAEAAFLAAIDLVEGMRAPLPAPEVRAAFLADKLTSYTEMARLCLAGGRTAEALEYVERARARALLEAQHGEGGEPVAPHDAAESALLAQQRTLSDELSWVYHRISRINDGEVTADHAVLESLWQEARAREAQILEISRRIQSGRPGSFADIAAIDLADLQHSLGPGAALIEYFALDGRLLAFVVTDEHLDAVTLPTAETEVEAVLRRLHFQIGALRHGAPQLHTHAAQLAGRAQSHMRELYDMLLRPIEGRLGDRNLVIAPHRALHYVPFHALFDGTSYVIERREVTYTPSARIFRRCCAGPSRPLEHGLLIGVSSAHTPHTIREVAELAPLFERPSTLLGEQATAAALRQLAPEADLIHLACHGQFRPDSPLFSSLTLADGQLTVREAYHLPLRCGLAVLSACETGVSAVCPGDELIGLAAAFFAAGAPALVVSLWPVDDEATADLMHQFYVCLRGGSRPASALRESQLAMMNERPHPFYWSPFVLIGRP